MHQNKPSDFIERNDIRAFLSLLRDWMAIFLIATVSIWANNVFVYLISVWAIGIFQFAIGEGLLHEAVHFNLFKRKSWNEQLEFLYGFPVFRTVSSYREHHFPHHSYFRTNRDYIPEYYEMLGLNKPDKNVFFLLFIKPIMGFSVYHFILDIYGDLQKEDWRPFKPGFKLIAFWLVVVIGFYLTGNLEILLLYWFVPLVWSYSTYSCWSEVQEHFNTISHSRSNLDFLTNFLTHNTGYHYVHHLYPSIPWYKLPEAHKAFCSDNPDISYGILDTYRQWTRKHVVSHANSTDSV